VRGGGNGSDGAATEWRGTRGARTSPNPYERPYHPGVRIVGHGIDLVEIARVEALIGRHGARAVERIFTPGEAAYAEASSRLRGQRFASRFAAKEAVFKALGTGWGAGIAWTEAEVVLLPSGAPTVRLHGRAAEIAAEHGITGWLVSLTHTATHAAASVIAVAEP